MMNLTEMGQQAKAAAMQLAVTPTAIKNQALLAMAAALKSRQTEILAANQLDIGAARDAGLNDAMLDRLLLTESRLDGIIADIHNVVKLVDPVGAELDSRVLPNGLRLSRRRVPLGVVGVIYEARPNVTIDIATLCLKTGNACILRGGKETVHSNRILCAIIQDVLAAIGLPAAAVQAIDNPDRALVQELLHLDQYVDIIIPRGGASLHKLCKANSTIPVIIGGFGISHLFVDSSADLMKAVDVIDNAKVQRPSACNSLDTLLVHETVAAEFLPLLVQRMNAQNVTLVADAGSFPLLQQAGARQLRAAVAGDFDTEWLSLTLGVRLVPDIATAIDHLHEHNACHSDAILTNDLGHAELFVNSIDSAAVYVNASTRFTDGAQFGLGAEVAVSTQKLHARGPMGLEELTSYKWIGQGDYLCRR